MSKSPHAFTPQNDSAYRGWRRRADAARIKYRILCAAWRGLRREMPRDSAFGWRNERPSVARLSHAADDARTEYLHDSAVVARMAAARARREEGQA